MTKYITLTMTDRMTGQLYSLHLETEKEWMPHNAGNAVPFGLPRHLLHFTYGDEKQGSMQCGAEALCDPHLKAEVAA